MAKAELTDQNTFTPIVLTIESSQEYYALLNSFYYAKKQTLTHVELVAIKALEDALREASIYNTVQKFHA